MSQSQLLSEATEQSPLIDVNAELEKESLQDSQRLSKDILKIHEINQSISELVTEQGEIMKHADHHVEDSSYAVEESTTEIKEASKLQKFKVIPIIVGAGIGAAICGIPSAFFLGSYSLACAAGGGTVGGLLGKTFS